jgi:hypothetical protein
MGRARSDLRPGLRSFPHGACLDSYCGLGGWNGLTSISPARCGRRSAGGCANRAGLVAGPRRVAERLGRGRGLAVCDRLAGFGCWNGWA